MDGHGPTLDSFTSIDNVTNNHLVSCNAKMHRNYLQALLVPLRAPQTNVKLSAQKVISSLCRVCAGFFSSYRGKSYGAFSFVAMMDKYSWFASDHNLCHLKTH